jgi:ATP-dependent RNA helicase SUPV3L1/SUV3
VLGPTNTGKTHMAMERMLGHASGMIGFPLRLLARENYDRAVANKGAASVALITGEEKIIPPHAQYFVCTVESMPVDRAVAFLAVDEIQLAADRERGHVFTDRLLHSRGMVETMFLGAETIRPRISQLVPGVRFETRPRFSKLSYIGPKKLTRLPRRAAVVAFSSSEVYGIADLLRRQRGGTAVVMGALSPRARNAQVELYQSGEVDYIVATDAIGMGLNMDVDHVAFASLSKFDGRAPRPLIAQEMAQIAGRAGRHMNDGTFGVTGDAAPIDAEDVLRIETHEFPPIKALCWRNGDLNYATIQTLIAGLQKPSPGQGLMKSAPAEDQKVLEILAAEEDVKSLAKGAEKVRLLWDVAQVPDFRKLRPETHARLLHQVYGYLAGAPGALPEDWVATHVGRLDRTDGDFHAVMDRIAAIRTWTYLANRPGWVQNAAGWQATTREVEDRLSDALHDKLTQQFIDRRTAHLVKKLRGTDRMSAKVHDNGHVEIDGHFVGHLEGLTFRPETTGLKTADRAIANSAGAALASDLEARALAITAAGDGAFSLNDGGQIIWQTAVVAKLKKGASVLRPAVDLVADDILPAELRQKVQQRLSDWTGGEIARTLAAAVAAESADLKGVARGIAFQVGESLGSLERKAVGSQIKALTEGDRKALARQKIRFGVNFVYVPDLLKAGPIRLRAILWRIAQDEGSNTPLPPDGRVSFATAEGVPAAYYIACGFWPVKGTAYRVDMVERFAVQIRQLLRDGAKELPPQHLSPLGIGADQAVGLLNALGFIAEQTDAGISIAARKKAQKPRRKPAPKKPAAKEKPKGTVQQGRKKPVYDPDSPFAKLKDLVKP